MVTTTMHFFIISALVANIYAQESAKYLESAIEELKNLNSVQSRRKIDAPHKSVPSLSLTKQELAKLYRAAVNKGDSVILNSDTGSHTQAAAVYEIHDDNPTPEYNKKKLELDHDKDGSGYYYYYFPLKSFMDDHYPENDDVHPVDTYHHEVTTATTNLRQYHTHKHEHNVHITATKHKVEEKKKLEPLFMAISGFIGMAVMFVVSVLVLPKIGVLKSRGSKEPSPEVTDVFRIIFRAIEGQDCADRFACELGKTAKAFNVHNNRFVKLIRRIAPTSVGKRLSDIDKYANKKYKCALIQCKKKSKPVKQKTNGKF